MRYQSLGFTATVFAPCGQAEEFTCGPGWHTPSTSPSWSLKVKTFNSSVFTAVTSLRPPFRGSHGQVANKYFATCSLLTHHGQPFTTGEPTWLIALLGNSFFSFWDYILASVGEHYVISLLFFFLLLFLSVLLCDNSPSSLCCCF